MLPLFNILNKVVQSQSFEDMENFEKIVTGIKGKINLDFSQTIKWLSTTRNLSEEEKRIIKQMIDNFIQKE